MGSLCKYKLGNLKPIEAALSGSYFKNGWLFLACAAACIFAGVSQAQVQFQDSTDEAGGPFHIGETWGASWGDLDGDIYPDMFSNNHGQKNGLYQNNGDGTFSDVTNSADLERIWVDDPLADIHGATWADIDNDGDQDLMVTRSSKNAKIQLMENNGQSQFEEKGSQYGIAPYGGGRMPLLFDYTNDGNLDVAIARNGGALEIFKFNPGNSRYQIQSSETGIVDGCERNNYAFISDLFNNDKQHYVCMSESGIPEKVYDMSTTPFTNVANNVGSVGATPDAVLADFNGDLRQDIFALRGRIRPSGAERVSSQRIEAWLSAGGSTNYEKSFTFEANGAIEVHVYARTVGTASGLKIGASGYSPNKLPVTLNPNNSDNWGVNSNHNRKAVFISYDESSQEWTITVSGGGNGSEGAYITVSGSDLTAPSTSGLGSTDRPITPTFLFNDGSALNSAGARGIGAISCGGVAAADFDNDMDIDLYLACRTAASNIPNRLYLNNGNGQFSLASGTNGGEGLIGSGIVAREGTAEMAVTADYNVDGFMDLYVTNGNRLFPHIVKDKFSGGGPVRFYKNLGNSNRWMQFDLRGVNSNRDGFGAKVIVTAGGQAQVREQNGMYHRWSHDSRRLHFGLASNDQASVRVEWPDGTIDTFNNVASNKLYRATQGGALTVLSSGVTTNPSGKRLSIASASVDEGSVAALNVTLDSASQSAITVDYQSVDGTAIDGNDYTANAGTLTFNAGQVSKTISFITLQDLDDEGGENFNVELSNPAGASILAGTAIVDIIDDDGASGQPTVSVSDVSIDEGGGSAAFIIALSEAASQKVSVSYATQADTAVAGQDFTARSGSVTFNVGEISKVRSVQVLNDTVAEPTESFNMVLSNPTDVQLGQTIGVATISDDDASGGQPTVSVSDVGIDEGGGSAAFVIALSEAANQKVSVSYATQAGTAVAGQDFTARSGSVTFNVGEISKVRSVQVLNDTVAEPTESFNMVLSNPTDVQLGQTIGVATISDDDAGGGPLTVSVSDVSVDENGGSAAFVIALSEAANQKVSVSYATQAGTAVAGQDFTARSGSVTFNVGEISKVRSVQILNDTVAEPTESFNMVLSNPTDVQLGQTIGVATINDHDIGGGQPTVSVSDVSIDEDGGLAAFVIALSEVSNQTVRVNYATQAGTAVAGQDFTARSGSVTFNAGDTSKTRSVQIVNDTVAEPEEGFSMVLSNPINIQLGQATGVATISDDDGQPVGPTINVATRNISVGEGDGEVEVIITLSEPQASRVRVDYRTVSGSAIAGADFTARALSTMTFSPGQTSKIRGVYLRQDALVEGDETFTLELSSPQGAALGVSVSSITIVDDD